MGPCRILESYHIRTAEILLQSKSSYLGFVVEIGVFLTLITSQTPYTDSSAILETDNDPNRGLSSAGVSPQYGNRKIHRNVRLAVCLSVREQLKSHS